MGTKDRPLFFLSVLLFYFISYKTHISIAVDTISPGQSLSGNQTITSQGGKFELGFFTPGNSQKYYIGIWFKNIPLQRVVWVANREKPLPNSSSQLKLSKNGHLVLLNQSKIQVWSTNSTSSTSNFTVAVLLDTGNLVLRDGSNSSVIIWQSFDHPTNTWLPGMKIGLNKITGETHVLTSWKSSEDPGFGIFSLEIDPNGTSQFFLIWNRTQRFWTGGFWNGQFYNNTPEQRDSNYTNIYVSNEKENYFTYYVTDGTPHSGTVVDFTGQLKESTWVETSQTWILQWARPYQCDSYMLCGAFSVCNQDIELPCSCLQGFYPKSLKDWNLSDWSGGCVRKSDLQCDDKGAINGQKDGFFMMPDVRFPLNSQSLAIENAEECELACLNNCACTAYAYSNGCLVWNEELFNLQQLSVGDSRGGGLYLRLSALELLSSTGKKRKAIWVFVGAVAGFIFVLGIIVGLIGSRRRAYSIGISMAVGSSLVAFSYRDLQCATKNFYEKLGEGGFGSVFKGLLPDSTAIAVKKLEGLRQGEKQFRSEVSTIGMIQHVNLVQLRGFCSEGTNKLLVYNYMPKGSLDSHLFRKDSECLEWKTRYQIALGIAKGLAYLHEECIDCIIHCDIKPENILLDAAYCPKIADFGLAKLLGREFSRVLTTMRGTRGYLAPEWISGLAITSKADVYSYGMLLFEIISGRRNSKQSEDGEVVFFPILAAQKINEGETHCLLDHRLEGNANVEELARACRVACWCIQDDEQYRPSIGQVVQFLEGTLKVDMPPIPRFLQILVGKQENSD